MAERPAFFIQDKKVISKQYTFNWFPGFAVSQKQKSIESLHAAILKTDAHAKPLEVSTKSTEPLGVSLSAFNLKLDNSGGYNVYRHFTIIASQLRLRHAHSGGYNVYRHFTLTASIRPCRNRFNCSA